MSFVTSLRYQAARVFRKAANRLASRESGHGIAFPNIGAGHLPKNAPRALVIYVVAGVERWLRDVPLQDPFFNKHTMYWESVEMVRRLNARGYVVDYADKRNLINVDWAKYALIIDQWDTLRNIPIIPNQKKVHYTTYIHWLPWNLGEHTRIRWFKERTGIIIPWVRSMPSIMSDQYADYLTYFGTQTQVDSFSKGPRKHQLNISAVYTPEYRQKNIEKARRNFMWLGGGGMVHKGLDIAMEAFARMPDLHLFIAGNPKEEPEFWRWAELFLARHTNIHLLGWMDVASPQFDAIAHDCIGIVYPSAAEGGPGSVAQMLHWGLIPVVTTSALVRAETLGHIIKDGSDTELIQSTVTCVQAVANASQHELKSASSAIIDFARKYHTRTAYSESFDDLLTTIVYGH